MANITGTGLYAETLDSEDDKNNARAKSCNFTTATNFRHRKKYENFKFQICPLIRPKWKTSIPKFYNFEREFSKKKKYANKLIFRGVVPIP